MHRLLAVGVMLGVVGLRAQAPAGPDAWEKLIAANNLEAAGKTPFHLGMTFQLYGLNGKPTEEGSLETWWSGPGGARTVVHLPGLNEDGSAPEGADAALVRDAYLVGQLLQSEVEPVQKEKATANLVSKAFSVGKLQLDCVGPKQSVVEDMNAQPTVACVVANTTEIEILQGLGGKVTLIRQRAGKFQDTYVGLETRLRYLGKDAISGKVTLLKAEALTKAEGEASATTADRKEVPLQGGVIAGHRISFTEPSYPEIARVEHLRGAVVLHAIIGVDGVVRRLVPIASTDQNFTDAAMEAVKRWKYSPYLLNGAPTEVDTTITVNFELNGG